jgi:tyrosine-protein kinase Etk/Wzc
MGAITSLRDLLSALWRRRWLIVLVTLLGLPLAYFYAASQPKVFEATAVIQIEAPRVAATVTGPPAAGQAAAAASVGAELDRIVQTLYARDTIEGLIARFGLFPSLESDTERVALTREAIAAVKLVDPNRAWQPDVQPSGLSITVRLDDPATAAALANALMDGIIEGATADARDRAGRTLDFLVAEEARVSGAIAEVEAAIAAFRSTNIASLPEGLTAQRERLSNLQERRIDVEREVLAFETGTARLRPEDAERQSALLDEQRELVESEIAETEAAIAAAPAVERELGALLRRLGSLEAELAVVTERRTEAAVSQQLESQSQAGGLSVLERAVIPEFAVSADRRETAILGAGAVVALALALALARELWRPAIRTAAQMEKLLGVEPLVVVPRVATRRGWRRATVALVAMGAATAVAATEPGREALREVAVGAGLLAEGLRS